MAGSFREWKTFSERWRRSSRLEKFLVWSAAAHLVAALVLGWMATRPTASQAGTAEQPQEQAARTEPPTAKEEEEQRLVEKAGEEIRNLLKQEIAEDHLRKLHEELTAEVLDPEMAEEYWGEVLLELDADLMELADMFDSPHGYDAATIAFRITGLKQKLIDRLEARAAGDRLDAVARELPRKVDEVSRQVVARLEQGLEEQVGRPVGEGLHRALQAEASASQAALARAEQELKDAQARAAEAASRLERGRQDLERLGKELAAAQEKKDTPRETEVKSSTRKTRTDILAASKDLTRARGHLRAAGAQLASHLPEVGKQTEDVDAGPAAAADEHARAGAEAAGRSQPVEAAQAAQQGADKAGEAAREIGRLHLVVQLQLAGDRAGLLARETTRQADEAGRIARLQEQAARSADTARRQEAEQAIQAAQKQAAAVLERAGPLEQQLARAVEAARQDGQGDERRAAAHGAAREAAARLRQARAEAQDAHRLLGEKKAEAGQARLEKAADQLEGARQAVREAQKHLGIHQPGGAEALARRLDEAVQQGLAGELEGKVRDTVRERLTPALLDRIGLARRDGEDPEKVQQRERLRQEAARRLGEQVGKLEPGEHFRKGAGEQLGTRPQPHPEGSAPHGPSDPQGKAAAERALAGARTTIDRQVRAVVDGALRQVQPGLSPDQATQLQQRLAQMRKHLGNGRDGTLGHVDGSRLALARARHQQRRAMLSRGGGWGGWDPRAYHRLAEAIKDRARITGEVLVRQGSEGQLSQTSEALLLKPALVSVPELPDPPKPTPPGERKLPEPRFKTHRFTGIPLLTDDAVTIDGDLVDWRDIPPFLLDPVEKGAGAKITIRPGKQTAYLAYCPRGLLVALDIVDTSGKLEDTLPLNSFWLNDGVEVYVDTLNTKASYRGESHTHQFFAFPFGHKDDREAGGYEARFQGKDYSRIRYGTPEMPRAARKTDRGWTMELLIPRAALRDGQLQPGRVLGFNIQVDTGTAIYYYWTAAEKIMTSMHPNTWGDLQLLGSDARIAFLAAKTEKPVTAFVPGESLLIELKDADMSLDDRKKDKVSVTASTATGQIKTVVLEETGERTGIFRGPLPTRLNIGARSSNELQVFEGEAVTVEYLDQVRAFGERNVPVKGVVPACSLGTRLATR